MSIYPANWPRCLSCGDFALDGHITCGRAECDESGAREQRRHVHDWQPTDSWLIDRCSICGEERA